MPQSNPNSLPTINLIGDERENFYQLGLKDRPSYSTTFSRIKALLGVPSPLINKVLEGVASGLITQWYKNKEDQLKNLKAYAEGLGLPLSEALYAMLIPELMSSLSYWYPTRSLPKVLFGCSSYLTWDENFDSPLHGRILDFPLVGAWDQHERAVTYELNGNHKIFSYSSAGFPYSGLTAMNNQGVTLALHQKFTNIFNPHGSSIFQLSHDLLNTTSTIDEAIKFIKAHPTITTWAFYMTFASGDYLRADSMAGEVYFTKGKLVPGKIYYLNNTLENPDLNQEDYMPYGFDNYCQMRKKTAARSIAHLQKQKNITDVKLLKCMAGPPEKSILNAQHWKMTPLTPSSLSINTFLSKESRSLYIPGEAPKAFTGEYLEIENVFHSPKIQLKNVSSPKWQKGHLEGMKRMSYAQGSLDVGNVEEVYHHMQMALAIMPTSADKLVMQFYFLIIQLMYEPNGQIYPSIAEELFALKNHLPEYLEQHCLLAVARARRLSGTKVNISSSDFKNEYVKRVFEKEMQLPVFLLKQLVRHATKIRMDNADIFYLHTS